MGPCSLMKIAVIFAELIVSVHLLFSPSSHQDLDNSTWDPPVCSRVASSVPPLDDMLPPWPRGRHHLPRSWPSWVPRARESPMYEAT